MLKRIANQLFLSIRGRLVLLTAALVVPAVLLAILLILESHHNERAAVERQLVETSRALSLVVDRQLGQAEATLKALAASPSLARGDLAEFYRQAQMALPGSDQWIALVAEDGQTLMSTKLPLGAPLPVVDTPDALMHALSRGETYISNLRRGYGQSGHVITITMPAENSGQDRRLVLATPPENLSAILADQRFPETWVAAIIDRDGTIVARNRRAEDFVGAKATPDIRSLVLAGSEQGVVESVTLDGMKTLAGYSRSPSSGWTLIIGAPASTLLAGAERLLLIAFAVAFGLVAVGMAMSAWIGRGVVRSVETLVAGAKAMGRGEAPPPESTGMRETDQVATALADAAARLKAREDDLKRLNETLETRVTEATETLAQARKVEAIGQLTGGIAHDFNNLLTAVRVNLDLLARRTSDEGLLRFVSGARQATDRGVKLVAQLLAFARKQRLQPERVDVNAVVHDMGDLLRSTLGGAVQVESRLAPGLEAAYADRTQLELIILNLAINARDAMERGSVRIETSRERIEAPPARPEHPSPGEYVVVAVSDTGTGMAPEVLARAFDPFFTTKLAGKGSGLGLPQALGIVKQLGGGMRIDSVVGRGTTVQVFLPLATASAAPSQPTDEVELASVRGLKVLLVDDDADVRTATAALLRDLGCEVAEADGGAALLESPASLREVDVALLDYAMPGMTGIELARHLAQARPELPIVLMSGYMWAAELGRAWPAPVLQKPFSKEVLAQRLIEATGATTAEASGKLVADRNSP
jgi:signal transduction histidine kinase/ActR/RegA family two-component response regulator